MQSRGGERAFTLVELLVVVSTIAVLAALLLPALSRAKDASYRAVCLSNLRQVGLAIATYAEEHQDRMPHGPKAPPFVTPSSLYPSTGAPTSLISLYGGAPVGLGLLIQQHLSLQPKVLFCPGSDQPIDADAELAKVGITQAQASYYYRHASNTLLSDPPGGPPASDNIRLHSLGKNRNGVAVRALAMDTLFLCPPELAQFSVKPRTHHQRRYADILFADGHAVSRRNQDERYTVNLQRFTELRDAFNRILMVLETADEEP